MKQASDLKSSNCVLHKSYNFEDTRSAEKLNMLRAR